MSALVEFSVALALLGAAGGVQPAAAQDEHQHHQQEHHGSSTTGQHKHHAQPSSSMTEQHQQHGHHADQPTESERAHVPPPPPEHEMGDMSAEQMAEIMGMDDTEPFGLLLFDQLEWRDTDAGDAFAWDGRAWYGNDYDKALLKTEGERIDGEYEGSTELLWDHVISRWWSLQAGISHDIGEGPSRTWAAFGVQGLAPYWFEVEALVYVGEQGRTAASFSTEYEMFLTQQLVLQPKLEIDLYSKDDIANGIGSGFSDAELGLRLRYEIRRELAPYIGVSWSWKLGETADLARAHGDDADEMQLVAGLRVWF